MPTVLGLTTDSKTNASATATADTQESSNSNGSSNMGKQRLDTISKRNHHAAKEQEVLFLRALCDSPEAAKEYLAPDAVMINPLFAGTAEPLSKDTDPSIDEILEGAEPCK